MFKEILEAANHVFGLSRELQQTASNVSRHEDEIRDLRQEVQRLSQAVERLTNDLSRSNERAESDREKFLLQIEVLLLKTERRIPPANETRTIE